MPTCTHTSFLLSLSLPRSLTHSNSPVHSLTRSLTHRSSLPHSYPLPHSLTHIPTDYFNDITTFVDPGFSRRTCEGVLEELVRRSISYALAAMDGGPAAAAAAMGVTGMDPGVAVLTRMAQDERDVQVRGGGRVDAEGGG